MQTLYANHVENNTRKKKVNNPSGIIIGCWRYRFVCWLDVLNIAIEHENYRFYRRGRDVHAIYEPYSQWGRA